MVQVFCKNTGVAKSVPEGTALVDILDEFDFEKPYPIVSAKVNNVSQGLKYRVYHSRDVEFLDVRETSGMRVYCRSLFFLLCKAAREALPGCRVYIEHPISQGYYCNVKKVDKTALNPGDVESIGRKMRELVNLDLAFHRHEVQTTEAIRIFNERGYEDKVRLLETIGEAYMDYYTLGDMADHYYGRLVPSTGYLQVWALESFHDGVLLRIPDRHNPDKLAHSEDQPKTFEALSEAIRWNIIMGLNNVGDVNHACQNGQASELIQVAEALQEKKVVQIAEEIERRYNGENPIRVVLITGPSSSGKTTFCQRLSVQLKACGLRPVSFSTDDYFVDRVTTPLLPDGSYDFDNFETVDHNLLEKDVQRLIAGEKVEVPEYNFVTGKREYNGRKLKLTRGSVLLIEGIHALNPNLIPSVDDSYKFRVFISTLTSSSLDNHNLIPTSDNRLIRRIMRDYYKGAFTAVETIRQWPKVCDAEEKWILPYQESADVMFNSAYLLEFAVLRTHAESILATVPKNCPEYSEAHRLLTFIHYFTPVSAKEIPSTSILKEFLSNNA